MASLGKAQSIPVASVIAHEATVVTRKRFRLTLLGTQLGTSSSRPSRVPVYGALQSPVVTIPAFVQ
jgi:hypothetical protein